MITSTIQLLEQLEQQMIILTDKLHELEESNKALRDNLAGALAKLENKQEISKTWQKKYEALKSAQGINTGDSASRKRALHHIDVLIGEVDACIAQLEISE